MNVGVKCIWLRGNGLMLPPTSLRLSKIMMKRATHAAFNASSTYLINLDIFRWLPCFVDFTLWPVLWWFQNLISIFYIMLELVNEFLFFSFGGCRLIYIDIWLLLPFHPWKYITYITLQAYIIYFENLIWSFEALFEGSVMLIVVYLELSMGLDGS